MDETSNNLWKYTNITSNNLNNKITNINTDTLPLGNTNRFIINDNYNRDLFVTGTLIARNLKVIDTYTTLQTNVYRSEKLEIINDSTATSLVVKQMNINQNLTEFYNSNNLTFLINSNANIGIGTNKLTNNYKLEVNGNVKCNDLFIDDLNISNAISQSMIFINSNSNYFENKINYLNTDTIPRGENNRFITNDIYGSPLTTFTGAIEIQGNSTETSALVVNQMNLNYSLIEFYSQHNLKFIIDKDGNVGINVIEPEYKLDVDGDINCKELYVKDENLVLKFDSNIYHTSNELYNYTTYNFSNVRNYNTFAYNSTVVDFISITTSESYIINSSNYTDTHFCVYNKNIYDSELLIQADFPYRINGYGSDHYSSRIAIFSDEISDAEYSLEHEQIFIGYAAGGGTRSTTLSPINHKTSILGNRVFIKVQLRLIDSDDSIETDKCIFIITEE